MRNVLQELMLFLFQHDVNMFNANGYSSVIDNDGKYYKQLSPPVRSYMGKCMLH